MSDRFRFDLAKAITADERLHRARAEQMWQAGDVIAALRLRGIADGLEMARDHQLRLTAEAARAGAIANDLGAQSFGPATGSDGDTCDWCDDETAGR